MIEITPAEAHAHGIDISVQRECLFFVAGGKLIERYWEKPDDDDDALPIKQGRYVYAEVTTEEAPRYSFTVTELGEGVRMVDVYQFIINNPMFRPFVSHYCYEHSMTGIEKFIPLDKLDGDIEYMELYRIANLNEHDTYYVDDSSVTHPLSIVEGMAFPSFHGIGYELKEDLTPEQGGFKKGERIPWGIMASKAETLAALPLVLNTTLKVYDDRSFMTTSKVSTVLECTCEYTLLEILKGIFWEMSWYGGPEDVDALKDEDV